MDLQDEIVKSFTLENYNWNDEWQHDDTDWKEGDCHSSVKFVITVRVLQLDDVHSSQGFEVVPDKLVSVDEHGDQETEEHDVEDEHKQRNEDLSLWELVLGEVLLTVETIEDV